MKIVGLAGSHASGKDTVAHYLVEKYGFYHVSTGDVFREEAMKKYGSIERPVLYKTANEIRKKQGHGAVSRLALDRYEKIKSEHPAGLIVSGFRAAAEAKVIKDAGGIIIYIDAPEAVRYERLKERARVEEGVLTFEDFRAREAAENGGVDPAFDISKIKDISDFVVFNEGNKEKFLYQIEKCLGFIS